MINELKSYSEFLMELVLDNLENLELFRKWESCKQVVDLCENLKATTNDWWLAKQLVNEYREIKNEIKKPCLD